MSSQPLPELLLNNVSLMLVEGLEGEDAVEVTLRSRSNSVSDLTERGKPRSRSFRDKVTKRLGKYGLLRSRSIEPNAQRHDYSPPVRRQRRASSMSPAPITSNDERPCPVPAPLLIEDPPSSENVSDLEDVKQQTDPALLNGSSGNFGSAGARSAPSTPQGILGSLPGSLSDTQSGIYHYTCSIPRSPSHNIFTKNDNVHSNGRLGDSFMRNSFSSFTKKLFAPSSSGGQSRMAMDASESGDSTSLSSSRSSEETDEGSIKQLSCSAPIMTAQAQSPEPPSPKAPAKESKHPTTSKARQKKFNRHFPAAYDEVVLNYYSCALISDILLQGHLYITRNYFAFYSNVFGYVTKLLIPMASVRKISKEKTARIIPNAVGITTLEDKHVFGSLMSRDSTYRLMNEVWDQAKMLEQCDEVPEPSILGPSDLSDSSETREESGRESAASDVTSRFRKCVKPPEGFPSNFTNVDSKTDKVTDSSTVFKESYFKLATASRQSLLLFLTTFILIMLFLSAAVLLYRIGKVQNRYTQALQDNFVLSESEDVYGELLQWQTHLHSKSAGAVHSFLDSNLDQIAKVRQSLEALSTLLIPSSHSASQSTATKPIDSPENS